MFLTLIRSVARRAEDSVALPRLGIELIGRFDRTLLKFHLVGTQSRFDVLLLTLSATRRIVSDDRSNHAAPEEA